MSCLCPPKELSAELPQPEGVEEVIPADQFKSVKSSAQDVSSLCQELTSQQELTSMSLQRRTITTGITSSDPNSFERFKKVEIKPTKKHAPSTSGSTRLGMAALTQDWSPIDHLVLGGLAANKDAPRPTYFPGLLFMVVCPEDTEVFTVSGKNKKLADGALKLASNSYLLLDETCSSVELKDLVIEGGHVVCHGQGCKATFTNVTFKNCCLITCALAKATLNGVKFENHMSHLLSVVSKDVGSKVFMHGGSITGGENGVLVSEGGRFHASDTMLQNIIATGVKAQSKKSLVSLTGCTFKKFLSIRKMHPATEAFTEGVHLRNQSTGTFQKVTIEGADVGIFVHGSTATVIDCTITNSVEKGCELKGGAKLTASGSSFSGSGPGPMIGVFSGVVAHDSGTNAVLNGCRFNGNNESAVTIVGGAFVMVSDSKAEGNKGMNARERKSTEKKAAFNIIGSGRMTVKSTAVVGETDACGGGKIEMVGVQLNGASVGK